MKARSVVALLAVGVILCPGHTFAAGAARVLDFDTSIRAAGMGGANAGVTWGEPDVWGNVATLGSVTGIRWEQGRTHLLPEVLPDVVLKSDHMLVGAGGVALCLSGKPAGLGRVRLDYGLVDITDAGGNAVGSFASYEQVRGLGVAVSIPRIVDDVLGWRGHDRWLAEALDLSAGVYEKRTHVEVGPPDASMTADATSRDWGVQGRLSPLMFLSRHQGTGWGLREVGLLDLGYGRSVLNSNDARFYFNPGAPGDSPTRMERSGFSIRAGAKLPPAGGSPWRRRVLDGLSPLLVLGYASDHDVNDGGTRQGGSEVDHSGFEFSVANVLTLRRGHTTDLLGGIDGSTTWGWGLGLPLGAWAGFRYDEASVPLAGNSGLPDRRMHGWVAWVDPLKIYRDLRAASVPVESED